MLVFTSLFVFQVATPVPPPDAQRRPVTAALLASAFRDSTARDLVQRARRARLTVDASLRSYDANTYRRITAGLSMRDGEPQRVFYRIESTGRVRWERGVGAITEITGKREAAPGAPGLVRGDAPPPVPYFPGREQLWIGTGGVAQAEVDERRLVNPLADGSEAYYTFAIGDSTRMQLPDGQRLVLRELRVTPRTPSWNVAVGSFWFDASSAQLVRATYRLSIPVSLSDRARASAGRGETNVPFLFRAVAYPISGQLTAVAVEYGLYDGRYWLPRVQTAEGTVKANLATLPIIFEEKFRYGAVNGDTKVALPTDLAVPPPWDSVRQLPADARARFFAAQRAERARQRSAQCARGTEWSYPSARYGGAVATMISQPCDTMALATSSTFEGPLFPADENPLAMPNTEALDRALGSAPTAGWGPRPIVWQWPPAGGMARFNRVEGLSLGAGVRQELGLGLLWDASLRYGTANREFTAEAGLARATGQGTLRLGAYRRLASLSDWGYPFSLGESALAALWARDEGFYAQATGVDVQGTRGGPWGITWRAFVEHQEAAPLATRRSLTGGGTDGRFISNTTVTPGVFAGLSGRARRTWGGDPTGWQLFADVRGEGAGGVSAYGRVAAEGVLTRTVGPLGLSLGGGLGTSAGTLPPQRAWFLGGARTIRGQVAGTQVGDAFRMAHAEVAVPYRFVRLSVFTDVGWAGDRGALFRGGRPLQGAGVGLSALDGLVRVDVSTGLAPKRTGPRLDFTVDARF